MREADLNKTGTSGMNRRSFLKASAGVATLAGLSLPGSGQAEDKGRLATLIDLSLCDGCSNREMAACVSACRSINKSRVPEVADPIPLPWPRKIIEDWSKKQDVSNRLTPYNLLYIQKVGLATEGQAKFLYIPRRCMHCDHPACATICPFSANHKRKSGAVVIDQDLCFGGAKCKTVCPWEIPQRQSGVGIYLQVLPTFMGNGVMFKCDLCHTRLEQGQLPGCIEACPQKAMQIGPRREIENLARKRAEAMNGYIYGQKENGGTSTLYVSPISFDLIQKNLEKKPGQPDMPTNVQRRMAKTDDLGKIVLAAPVLGVVAGAAGAWKWISQRKADAPGKDEHHD
jgi:formate dehydrogenase iron-sulfur subunit